MSFEVSPGGSSPRVQFKVGGLRVGRFVDGLKFAKYIDVTLTDRWRDYRIDLSANSRALESVVCPFAVVVTADDNPNIGEVTVYVDNIRFEAEDRSTEAR